MALLVVAGVAGVARPAWSAEAPAAPSAVAPSSTQFAHELFRLRQIDLIRAQARTAASAEANLWKAQATLVQFDALTKDKADEPRISEEYLAARRA